MSAWPSAQPPRIGLTQAFSSCEPSRSSTRLTSQKRSRKPLHRGTGGMRMMTATLVLLLSVVPAPGRAASLQGAPEDVKPQMGGADSSTTVAVPAGPGHGTNIALTVAEQDGDGQTTTTRRVTVMSSRLVRSVSPTRGVLRGNVGNLSDTLTSATRSPTSSCAERNHHERTI